MNRPPRLSSNGRYWLAEWVDSSGRRRAKSLGAKDQIGGRRAAQKLVDELAAEHARTPGMDSISDTPTIDQWAKAWPTLRCELKPNTLRLYRQTFDRLTERFGGSRRLDALTPIDVAAWRSWISREKPKRPGSDELTLSGVDLHVRNAKVIFGFAVKMGRLGRNPFAAIPSGTVVASEWRYVAADEVLDVMAKLPPDWSRLVALARFGGLRRGEARRLCWEDIDETMRSMRVLPEMHQGSLVSGTKQRHRVVPISPELRAALGERGRGPVCLLPAHNFDREMGKSLARAGASGWGKPLHTLRKSLATDWCRRCDGRDLDLARVATWLGHSVDVLMRHYHTVIPGAMSVITDPVPNLLGNQDKCG